MEAGSILRQPPSVFLICSAARREGELRTRGEMNENKHSWAGTITKEKFFLSGIKLVLGGFVIGTPVLLQEALKGCVPLSCW